MLFTIKHFPSRSEQLYFSDFDSGIVSTLAADRASRAAIPREKRETEKKPIKVPRTQIYIKER